jgi:hypothetical protein
MADTLTPNLSLTKPEIGGSDDTWGNKLNANWDKVDSMLFGGSTKIQVKNGVHVYELSVTAAGVLEVFYTGVKIADLSTTGKLRVKEDVEAFAF